MNSRCDNIHLFGLLWIALERVKMSLSRFKILR